MNIQKYLLIFINKKIQFRAEKFDDSHFMKTIFLFFLTLILFLTSYLVGLDYYDVSNLSELPQLPEGYRYFDFIGGSKEIRCFVVSEDMPRNKFIEENEELLGVHLKPIYKYNGICVRQDSSYALPGFYIVSPIEHYRSLDEVDEVTHARLFFILREIRKGMREALNIQYAHVYYEEKANKSCNVHYWILPINDIKKYPRLYNFNVKDYLEQFLFSSNKERMIQYNELMRAYIEKVNLLERDKTLTQKLQHPSFSFAERFTYFPNGKETALSEIGGKAENLNFLQKISDIQIPPWFCISSKAFQQFLLDNHLESAIKDLEELCSNYSENEEAILKLGKSIRDSIIFAEMKQSLLQELQEAYIKLKGDTSEKDFSVAVRSSGILEDLPNSSFAGLYDTYLNRKGFDDIRTAIKQVWASSFNPRLIFERARAGIKQEQCLIAVIVQKMVDAKAAGVATSIELSSNYPGIEIAANYGLGESVVGGEVSVDKWLVHSEKNFIIKSIIGDKQYYNILNNELGLTQLETESSKQAELSLDNETVLKIADQVKLIKSYYGCEIDTEFAIDKKGSIFFLQARPLVAINTSKIFVVDPEDVKNHKIIASGEYSVPGVTYGRLKFIEKWEELAKKTESIQMDEIVVAYVALNYWSHYLTQFKGLITKQGGPTSHPILLCRERQVPCLIGIGEDFENLRKYNGQEVTLDGISRVVYAGKVALKEASPADLAKSFETVEIRPWPSFEKRKTELMKANFLFEEEGKFWLKNPTHPLRKLFQEIHLKRFDRIPEIVNGVNPLRVDKKVIDNYVCFALIPTEKAVEAFNGMSLQECEVYSKNHEKNMQDYLQITENFELDPIIWQKYLDIFIDYKAYYWLAEVFRLYLDREIEIQASALALPQCFLDECSAYAQSQFEEEDIHMQREIYELASRMRSLPIYENVLELKKEFPQIFDEIETLGKRYRFDRDISIEKPLDMHLVYNRLLSEIKENENGKSFVTSKNNPTCKKFFPQNPVLRRWIYLSIYNRILQSNSHHYQMRGQWKVREKLLELGEYLTSLGILKKADHIFDLSSEEIKAYIINWQNKQRG